MGINRGVISQFWIVNYNVAGTVRVLSIYMKNWMTCIWKALGRHSSFVAQQLTSFSVKYIKTIKTVGISFDIR